MAGKDRVPDDLLDALRGLGNVAGVTFLRARMLRDWFARQYGFTGPAESVFALVSTRKKDGREFRYKPSRNATPGDEMSGRFVLPAAIELSKSFGQLAVYGAELQTGHGVDPQSILPAECLFLTAAANYLIARSAHSIPVATVVGARGLSGRQASMVSEPRSQLMSIVFEETPRSYITAREEMGVLQIFNDMDNVLKEALVILLFGHSGSITLNEWNRGGLNFRILIQRVRELRADPRGFWDQVRRAYIASGVTDAARRFDAEVGDAQMRIEGVVRNIEELGRIVATTMPSMEGDRAPVGVSPLGLMSAERIMAGRPRAAPSPAPGGGGGGGGSGGDGPAPAAASGSRMLPIAEEEDDEMIAALVGLKKKGGYRRKSRKSRKGKKSRKSKRSRKH